MNPTIERYEYLSAFEEDAHKCMRCGFCRAKCPTYSFIGWESGSPRGRMQQLYAILQQRITPTAHVHDRLMKCTTCGYCEWRCPSGVKTTDSIEAGRAELLKIGFELQKHHEAGTRIREVGNPYGYPRAEKALWKEDLNLSDTPKTLLFSGCTHPYTSPSVLRDAFNVLRQLDLNTGGLGGKEPCCGSFLLRTGQRDAFERLAASEFEALNDPRVETIVTLCPGCYKTISREIAPGFLNPDLRIVHFVSLVSDLMDRRPGIKLRRIDRVVTYHDPCHLGRHMGVFEEPRKILENIPGLRFVEMAHNRNLAVCCGSGGGVRSAYPEMAAELARIRLQEAKDTGADLLVTSCPFCERAFKDAMRDGDRALEVLDLAELMQMTLLKDSTRIS